MTYIDTLKKIRLLRNIKQVDMLPNSESHSTYAKIENGTTKLRMDTLEILLDRLELSMDEFIFMSNYDEGVSEFLRLFKQCFDKPKDKELKKYFLSKYYPKKIPIEKMSKQELVYYCSIKNQYLTTWNEIKPFSDKEIEYVYSRLAKNKFHTQYDYSILLNACQFFSESQTNALTEIMFPVTEINLRTPYIINSAANYLANMTTKHIYLLEYEKAWKYIELSETIVPLTTGYYSKMNLQFNKCIVLRYLKKESIYIEKARHVISATREIGDNITADKFEEELNKLLEKADYYLDQEFMNPIPLN